MYRPSGFLGALYGYVEKSVVRADAASMEDRVRAGYRGLVPVRVVGEVPAVRDEKGGYAMKVKCIDAEGTEGLEKGKVYDTVGQDLNRIWIKIGDYDNGYLRDRFIYLDEPTPAVIPVPTNTTYPDLGREIGELVASKQKAYGSSFQKAGDVMRILYPEGISPEKMDDALAIVRVIDKLFRLATDKTAFGESAWGDVCGYSLLGLARDRK